MLAAAQPEKSVGQIFNLGGGEEVNVNQVLGMLEELTGQPAHLQYGPPRPGDQLRTVADTTKAHDVLGYTARTRVIDGLRAQVAWQRAEMGL